MSYYYETIFADQLDFFKHIHSEVATMTNGIRKLHGPGWNEYSPSDFLYSFVFFNTLYAIDWERSLDERRIIKHRDEETVVGRRMSESEMQEKYIHFFYTPDNSFVEKYKVHFINYILKNGGGKASVMNSLQEVRFRGKYKDDFLSNFDSLISGNFDEQIILDITSSIYRVRCNIFHGTKTIKDLGKGPQQKRLAIYTFFLIALNQMLFSYLDYRELSEDFASATERAFNNLNKNWAYTNASAGNQHSCK